MILFLALIMVGSGLLYFGGDLLLRGAMDVGRRLGWSQAIIGLILVSLGTSAPELFVSAGAAIQGLGDMAVGNVVGSNIANIAIVLGIGSVTLPLVVDRTLRVQQIPVMVALTIVSVVMLADGEFTRIEGSLLLLATISGIGWTLRAHYASTEPVPRNARQSIPAKSTLQVIGGIVLLVAGAEAMIWGGVNLATTIGISQAVIGLTVIAIGTSLPEIAATLVAVLRREADLAVGNVVGSNILNLGLVLGFSGVVTPLNSGDVGLAPLYVLLALTLVLGAFAWNPGHYPRWLGAGLLLSYAGYVGFILV